jgi:hypothetical protein
MAKKFPVTRRALVQRINRRLPLQKIKASRGRNVGGTTYSVVDKKNGRPAETDLDLEQFGRECGALEPYETLVD